MSRDGAPPTMAACASPCTAGQILSCLALPRLCTYPHPRTPSSPSSRTNLIVLRFSLLSLYVYILSLPFLSTFSLYFLQSFSIFSLVLYFLPLLSSIFFHSLSSLYFLSLLSFSTFTPFSLSTFTVLSIFTFPLYFLSLDRRFINPYDCSGTSSRAGTPWRKSPEYPPEKTRETASLSSE